MKNIIYFDLETQKSAEEVGGWDRISAMGMSVGVTYSTARGDYRIYGEKQVNDLLTDLQRADLVVGADGRGRSHGRSAMVQQGARSLALASRGPGVGSIDRLVSRQRPAELDAGDGLEIALTPATLRALNMCVGIVPPSGSRVAASLARVTAGSDSISTTMRSSASSPMAMLVASTTPIGSPT